MIVYLKMFLLKRLLYTWLSCWKYSLTLNICRLSTYTQPSYSKKITSKLKHQKPICFSFFHAAFFLSFSLACYINKVAPSHHFYSFLWHYSSAPLMKSAIFYPWTDYLQNVSKFWELSISPLLPYSPKCLTIIRTVRNIYRVCIIISQARENTFKGSSLQIYNLRACRLLREMTTQTHESLTGNINTYHPKPL